MLARLSQRGRADDQAEIIARRIQDFKQLSLPVVTQWFIHTQQAHIQTFGRQVWELPNERLEEEEKIFPALLQTQATDTTATSTSSVNTSNQCHVNLVNSRPAIPIVYENVRQAYLQFTRKYQHLLQ